MRKYRQLLVFYMLSHQKQLEGYGGSTKRPLIEDEATFAENLRAVF
jgi:hypothetical protein